MTSARRWARSPAAWSACSRGPSAKWLRRLPLSRILPARDALHILRTTFRSIRERSTKTESGIAKALPATVDDVEDLL